MEIIGQYKDSKVLPIWRFDQMEIRHKQVYETLLLKVVGIVRKPEGSIWLVYKSGSSYFKTYFAKNQLWFNAITSDEQLKYLKDVEQIFLV